MADGYAGHQIANVQRQLLQHRLGRGSPPRLNDTPSPSRSPAPQSPGNAHNFYQQSHHGNMMHGTGTTPSHQRFALPPGSLNFQQQQQQQQQQHPHAHQHHQHHQHQQQQSHHSGLDHSLSHPSQAAQNGGPHQHGYSSGGVSTAQYPVPQAGSGTPQQNFPPFWQEQIEASKRIRSLATPHQMSRNAAALSRRDLGNPDGNLADRVSLRVDGHPLAIDKKSEHRNEAGQVVRQDWTGIDMSGQGLRILSPPIFHYTFLDSLWINHNNLQQLPPAIGRLKNLTLLDVSGNRLTDLPPEIGMLSKLEEFNIVDNSITTLPFEMGQLWKLKMLALDGNPLEDKFKSIVMNGGTKALILDLRERAPEPPTPPARPWIVPSNAYQSDPNDPNELSLLCYNILCDSYATEKMFGFSPVRTRSWEYRKDLIIGEIEDRDADIVCLQEIDQLSFYDVFCPKLAYKGYKGVFWPKTRASTMSGPERQAVDGCATFYKNEKYTMVSKEVIDFRAIALKHEGMKKQADVFDRVMPRDNVAVATFLENKTTGARLLITNVHVFWNPDYRDVKVIQVAMLLEELKKLADGFAAEDRETPANKLSTPHQTYEDGLQIPLVICGDFNSTADSGVYELLDRGKLTHDHDDLNGRAYGDFTVDGISHPFNLKSAYSPKDLCFTNYTPGFFGMIDYIWYSQNLLETISLLGDIDKKYMERVPGFPNAHFPSDHISLMAKFKIKPRKEAIAKPPPPDFGNGTRK